MFLLDQACQPIREAFPDYGPYLVGTALDGPHNDVDVRLIMQDEAFDAMADGIGMPAVWFLGLAIGEYLASRTGLNIDFQIQRATQANAVHSIKRRNPLGYCRLGNYQGDTPTHDIVRTGE